MTDKKIFTGRAKIESKANMGTVYTFKLWEKGDIRRIYSTCGKDKAAGYIDLNNGNECVSDCKAYRDAMEEFLSIYNIEKEGGE